MSDEDDYEQFMMSEEDISSFEMEQDSNDNEDYDDNDCGMTDDSVVRVQGVESKNNYEWEKWYSLGKAFKCDRQYEVAKRWFRKCTGTPVWQFKSLKQVIKCEVSEGLTIERSINELFRFVENNVDDLGKEYCLGSLRRLLQRLVPDLNGRCLLLGENDACDVEKLEHALHLLRFFDREWLKVDKEIQEIIHIRELVYSVWIHILGGEHVPDLLLQSMILHRQFETYFLLLQIHLQHYLEKNQIELTVLQTLLIEVDQSLTDSLSVSQQPMVTSIYHFARFLEYWKRTTYQEDDEIICHCEEQLVLCIQDLETAGFQKYVQSDMFQLSLIGLVFCNMLLTGEDRVVPFEREQLKVLQDIELVKLLKQFYHCWTTMDLCTLSTTIAKLRPFYSPWFDKFEQKLVRTCQMNKLWNQIAITYSHISLPDLLAMLHINETIPMTRDNFLTLLMQSIANDTAKVYYKLNLQSDYVYFGNEFRVPLRSVERTFIPGSSEPPLFPKNGPSSNYEWLSNVDNWNAPLVLQKNTTAIQFIDALNTARLQNSQHTVSNTSLESYLLKLSLLSHEIAQSSSTAPFS